MEKEKLSDEGNVDDGIVIHTFESDMSMMGVKESNDKDQEDGKSSKESNDKDQEDENSSKESRKESNDKDQEDENSSKESNDKDHKDGDDDKDHKDGPNEKKSNDKDQEDENSRSKKLSRKERRIQRLANENKKLREENEKLKKKHAKQSEPNIDDYESYDDYLKAIENGETKEESVDDDLENYEAQQELLANGKDSYDDFEELVCAEDLALTQDILDIITDMDNGEDVAYYLAKHKDETRKIANMPFESMYKSLLRIEVDIEKSQKKSTSKAKVTNAPDPIKPVNGSGVKAKTIDDGDLSFEEHEALLNSRSTKNHGGFL